MSKVGVEENQSKRVKSEAEISAQSKRSSSKVKVSSDEPNAKRYKDDSDALRLDISDYNFRRTEEREREID